MIWEIAVNHVLSIVQPCSVHIRYRRLYQFNECYALCLRPVRGTLWVTIFGKTEDFLLEAGQQHQFDAHTQILVSTLGGDALVNVIPQAICTDRFSCWWSLQTKWLNFAAQRAR